MFAKFDEIPSMILEVIKETKRYRHTFGRSDGRSFGRTDNVKTVYPPTNTVCGGYNDSGIRVIGIGMIKFLMCHVQWFTLDRLIFSIINFLKLLKGK